MNSGVGFRVIYRSGECDLELSEGKDYLREILYRRDTGNEKQEKVGEKIYKQVIYKKEQYDTMWHDGSWEKINNGEAAGEYVIYEHMYDESFRTVRYCIITKEKEDGRCHRRFFGRDKDEV